MPLSASEETVVVAACAAVAQPIATAPAIHETRENGGAVMLSTE